jgi:hypothetical protein
MDNRHSIHIPHWQYGANYVTLILVPQYYSIQVCWSAKLEKSRLTMLFFNASIEIPCVTPLFIQLFKHSPLLTLPKWHLSHDLCGVRLGFGRYVYGKNIYSHFRQAQISLSLHFMEPPIKRPIVDWNWSFGDKGYVFVEVIYRRANNIKLLNEMMMVESLERSVITT